MPAIRLARLSFLTLLASIATACSTTAEVSQIHAFVDRYYANFQRPGFYVDDLMNFYSDEAVFTDPTFGIAVKGKPQIRELYADLGTEDTAYRDIDWDLRQVIAERDKVVIRGVWSGSFQGCAFSVDFMTLWLLEDQLIKEQNDFFAADAFDEQVQWDPSTGTANCTE
ncbi:MAG: nuclear transport factor 2 family protein [Gammaproteobacteria bacterium]